MVKQISNEGQDTEERALWNLKTDPWKAQQDRG